MTETYHTYHTYHTSLIYTKPAPHPCTFSLNRLYRSSAKTNQRLYFLVDLYGRHLGTDGQMARTTYLFGTSYVDQQSKQGAPTKPYMLDSL
ncbi:hypothetical protein LINPERHAP2_LOCUS1614 [Linum perenne]